MMDDIAESQDLSKEISEAISNPVAFGTDVDEVGIIFVLHNNTYRLSPNNCWILYNIEQWFSTCGTR